MKKKCKEKRRNTDLEHADSYYDTLLDFIAYYFLSDVKNDQKKEL